MSKEKLVKSTGTISIATAISRMLGFARDILIANFFGTAMAAQAFVIAFKIPNMLRILVGEGATNAAIVPILTEYEATKSKEEYLHLYRVLFNISFVVLLAIVFLGILLSPILVRAIAPGFIEEPQKIDLAVRLNCTMFPYILLIGLTAFSIGTLNSMRHFAAPAFGPALSNLVLIVAIFWLCPKIGVWGLAAGVLAGGVFQLLLNLSVLYKKGLSLNIGDGFRHIVAKKVVKLLIPRISGTAVYQINVLVDTILASLAWIVGTGGVAALYFANRLIQFPLGIFGIAMAQAALPRMSQQSHQNNLEDLRDTVSFSLRSIFLVMLPATFGLAILGEPIVRVLFERGNFTPYSTLITKDALFFYAFGLCSYGGIKILVNCFYSMQDTITPVKTAALGVVLNIILNLILMWPLKLGGLALATSISATFNFVMLYCILARRIGDPGTGKILSFFVKAILASSIMGVFCWWSLRYLIIGRGYSEPQNLALLGLIIISGVIVFVLASLILRVEEMRKFLKWILRKR